MTTLLHIASSPRGTRSESLALAGAFLDGLREAHPSVQVEEWDLWDGTLPSFGPDGAGAKMRVFAGEEPEGREQLAWRDAGRAIERFLAADAYLFSLPMWNASVPYITKQFIDVVSQPGSLFGFDPERGYTGLVADRPTAVLYSSAVYGDERGPAFGSDFQRPYFEDWLRWIGIRDIRTVQFRPDLVTADADAERMIAHRAARELGGELLRANRKAA